MIRFIYSSEKTNSYRPAPWHWSTEPFAAYRGEGQRHSAFQAVAKTYVPSFDGKPPSKEGYTGGYGKSMYLDKSPTARNRAAAAERARSEMSILTRLSELLTKQNRLNDELGEVDLEIARTERELLHDWLAQHPEHREGQLIDYVIRGAPGRKQQVIKAKIHHVDVAVFGDTAHFSAQVFLPKDSGWELINRRVSLGSMEIKA